MDENWDKNFANRLPKLFEPLADVAKPFTDSDDWPSLQDFQTAFESQKLSVYPVEQGAKPTCFEEHYEPRIYRKGELQTRLKNWHDFFNALVWLRFPKTKAALNHRHYLAAKNRPAKSNRSKLENRLTLFDECGAIILAKDPELLDMIRQHQWRELFWDNRERLTQELSCTVFGHAIYEKALNPYIGMTCNVILIQSDDLDGHAIDALLAEIWNEADKAIPPQLHPLPVLGMPGWYGQNNLPEFYDNTDYFRPSNTNSTHAA